MKATHQTAALSWVSLTFLAFDSRTTKQKKRIVSNFPNVMVTTAISIDLPSCGASIRNTTSFSGAIWLFKTIWILKTELTLEHMILKTIYRWLWSSNGIWYVLNKWSLRKIVPFANVNVIRKWFECKSKAFHLISVAYCHEKWNCFVNQPFESVDFVHTHTQKIKQKLAWNIQFSYTFSW